LIGRREEIRAVSLLSHGGTRTNLSVHASGVVSEHAFLLKLTMTSSGLESKAEIQATYSPDVDWTGPHSKGRTFRLVSDREPSFLEIRVRLIT
jgi:hypothetical protein